MPVLLNYAGGLTSRTVGGVVSEARAILNDIVPSGAGNTLAGTFTEHNVGSVIQSVRAMLMDQAPENGISFSRTSSLRNIASVIFEARTLLNDTDPTSGYRYPEGELYLYFNTALLNFRRIRPDLFIIAYDTGVPVYSTGNGDVMFPLIETMIPAVAYFIAGQAEMRDDSTGSNERAQAFLAQLPAMAAQTPFRYSDYFLYSLFTRAIMHVRRMRPDLAMALTETTGVTVYQPALANEPFPLGDAMLPPVVGYMLAQARKRDALMQGKPSPDPEDGGLAAAMESAPSRFADTDLYRFVGDALLEIRNLRPDLFLGKLRASLPQPYVPTDANTAFPVNESYFPAFVHYVVAKALLRPLPADKSKEAAGHLALWSQGVGR